jgi:hypothetical protein
VTTKREISGVTEDLREIAARTWNYFDTVGVDPGTRLPRGMVPDTGPAESGNYTSSNHDRPIPQRRCGRPQPRRDHTISRPQEAKALLTSVEHLHKHRGFLLRCYSTSSGDQITRGDRNIISSVDNAWYAQALVVGRRAFPKLADRFTALLDVMQWEWLYDEDANAFWVSYDLDGQAYTTHYRQLYAGRASSHTPASDRARSRAEFGGATTASHPTR